MKTLVLLILLGFSSTSVYARQCGIVKWYKEDKGFGFITPIMPSPYGEEAFVTWKDLVAGGDKPLVEGQKVIYDAVRGQDEFNATRVQVVSAFPNSCEP
jgi:CspA family cold shock protein